MSFTFFAKSSAYSWKMSFAGHVLCQRIVCAPVDETTAGAAGLAGSAALSAAIAIIGIAAAVPAAAPLRNLRRDSLGRSSTGFLAIASPPGGRKGVVLGLVLRLCAGS